MKIKTIEISHFKAFWEPMSFDIETKNVLIYGNNGSGKSSFYQALYWLLQSSVMPAAEITARFDKDHAEHLIHFDAVDSTETYVKVVLDNESRYQLALKANTDDDVMKLANQASEFMNYRLLFAFYYFRHTENTNLFPVFLHEIFPYWTDTTYGNYSLWFDQLTTQLRQLKQLKMRKRSPEYTAFIEQINMFNAAFEKRYKALIEPINQYLQKLLNKEDIKVRLTYLNPLAVMPGTHDFTQPQLQLTIAYRGKEIKRPHTILNESRLTAMALAIRLAIFDNRLQEAEFKILVLDDLLLSFDMSNRIKIFSIFLFDKKYKDYQKFILTHDKGLFEIIKKNLELHQSGEVQWKFYEFYETDNYRERPNPIVLESQDSLTKAQTYFKAKDFESAALYLRKKVEELMRIYFDPSLETLVRHHTLEKLAHALRESVVEKEYYQKLLNHLTDIVSRQDLNESKIAAIFDSELTTRTALTDEERGKLKTFQQRLKDFLTDHYQHKNQKDESLRQLKQIVKYLDELRARILNVGAHYNDTPLFEIEIMGAIDWVKKFQDQVLQIHEEEERNK